MSVELTIEQAIAHRLEKAMKPKKKKPTPTKPKRGRIDMEEVPHAFGNASMDAELVLLSDAAYVLPKSVEVAKARAAALKRARARLIANDKSSMRGTCLRVARELQISRKTAMDRIRVTQILKDYNAKVTAIITRWREAWATETAKMSKDLKDNFATWDALKTKQWEARWRVLLASEIRGLVYDS